MLAVDPGATSGWAIWIDGALYDSGTCNAYDGEPEKIVKYAQRSSAGPLVLAIERPFMARGQSAGSAGAADKVWRVIFEKHVVGKRVVRVYPPTWRSAVLGGRWATAKREHVRRQELAYVEHQYGIEGCHPDEAPAILIGKWAITAAVVGEKLPKRVRAA